MLNYWDADVDDTPWNIEEIFESKKELKCMMENWDERFFNVFAEGFQMYVRGNWPAAKNKFSYLIKNSETEDGPSKSLLKIMAVSDYKAPKGWLGYRDLNLNQ